MEIVQQRQKWIDYFFAPFRSVPLSLVQKSSKFPLLKRLLNTNFEQLYDGWLF